jgi:hypothetical protein
MTDLERLIRVIPAYDCIRVQPCKFGKETCKPDSGGNHGNHNAELILTLKGPEGAVEFVVGTNWYLPVTPSHVANVTGARGRSVSYHSPTPMYEGHTDFGPCMYIGEHCYADTNYSMADECFKVLVEKGHEAVWEQLSYFYNEIFFGSN